jgi:carbamoyltransferase
MIVTGVSHGFHDAAICYLDGKEIVEAHHSERITRVKNDKYLHSSAQLKGTSVFYEKPFKKNVRRYLSGMKWRKAPKYDHYIDHHWSHAAAAYYSRPFPEEPVCVVIDAIGEFDTASIWYDKEKVWSMKYPRSLGLFYSAITDYVGLKPLEDEYILMGMAAYGDNVVDLSYLMDRNLQKGCRSADIPHSHTDIAASAQHFIEQEIIKIMTKARQYSNYLCYGGGVALNCVVNTKIYPMFDGMWIFPNPGDAGSSFGAAAAYQGEMINWRGPYLGTNIEGDLNVKDVVKYLIDNSYCGVASGRAEFGPRALGNRSLLADPRRDVKDTVNQIKRRQKFRPFAPAILDEFAEEYFEGPMNEYMQFVAKAKHDYSSVTHVDGTARVQVVKQDCPSVIRPILEEWYEQTGCPMLLNTSLNIKGMPMVDTARDARKFQDLYGVRVFWRS